MLPGNTATKKAATTQPTSGARADQISSAEPNTISTTPDANTTKSVLSGTQDGTCAAKAVRAQNRWLSPAKTRNAPNRARPMVRDIDFVMAS